MSVLLTRFHNKTMKHETREMTSSDKLGKIRHETTVKVLFST